MKVHKNDLIKMSSLAFALIAIIAILGIYLIPNYIFVNANHRVFVSGLIDHKKISESYINGELKEKYTISVRLFEDDPINNIKSGTTLAYFISYDEWLMIEWGDTVILEMNPHLKTKLAELYPALKLPEWHSISGSSSLLGIEAVTDKAVYAPDEKISIEISIKNSPSEKGWTNSPIPVSLSLLQSPQFYVFKDGKTVYRSPSNLLINEITLDPENEITKNLEFDLKILGDTNSLEGIYYVRFHLGHFSENKQITLTCTTMIEIENK